MRRIRYKQIDVNTYNVILPDHSEDSIGLVYRDIFKKSRSWFLKPHFITLYKDIGIVNSRYDDFSAAGRALADIWEYTTYLTNGERTDEYTMDDLFKNIGP